MPKSDVNRKANTKKTDENVVIEYYLQQADGTYPDKPDVSITTLAKIGEEYTASVKEDTSKTAVAFNRKYYQIPETQTITISEDNSRNTVKYYYPRTTFKINLTYDNGISAVRHYSMTDSKTKDSYRWGENVRINADVADGYEWSKWTGVSDITDKRYDFKMPSGDVYRRANTIARKTTDNVTEYTVRHWKQRIFEDGTQQYTDGSVHDTHNYFLAEEDKLKGTADMQVTPDVKDYEGFTSPSVQTVIISGDGSLVVDYYYTRNRYKVDGGDKDNENADADAGNGIDNITGGGTYYYEEEVSMEAHVKPGYHWHISDDCHTDITQYTTGWKVARDECDIDKFLDNTGYGSQNIRFAMPAHNVYVKADATNNSYTILFDANGGTGDMQEVEAIYNIALTLPDNTFTRTTPSGSSTFLLWEDRNNDATYDDNEEVISLTDEFNGIITLYARWDDAPEITAQERWFTVDDAQNNKITLEEMLSTVRVTDDIDTDIEDSLTVKYYSQSIFNQFKTDEYVIVTYTARDSSNNTTEAAVKVNIVDTTAVEEEKNTYVRFIGPEYYKESYENGGLEENSIWRKNPEYAATLERAMKNRESMTYSYNETTFFGIKMRARKAACDSRDHLVEQWVFIRDDVKAVKEYVNEHGIGNLKEADALANFRLQFARCKTQ